MERRIVYILSCFVLTAVLCSCNYSLPLLKLRTGHSTSMDSLGTRYVKTKASYYGYISITKHGITGDGAKIKYYDAEGHLIAIHLAKNNAACIDCEMVSKFTKKEFDSHGKLRKVTFIRAERKGWNDTWHERTVDYSSGSRVVTVSDK